MVSGYHFLDCRCHVEIWIQLRVRQEPPSDFDLPESQNLSNRCHLRENLTPNDANLMDQSCFVSELFRNIEMVTELQKLMENVIS